MPYPPFAYPPLSRHVETILEIARLPDRDKMRNHFLQLPSLAEEMVILCRGGVVNVAQSFLLAVVTRSRCQSSPTLKQTSPTKGSCKDILIGWGNFY